MDDDQASESYALVFPFVCVASEGGPYADEAFVAGVQLGRLIERLKPRTLATTSDVVFDALVVQCDLMAMAYGYTSTVVHTQDGWTHLGFMRIAKDVA